MWPLIGLFCTHWLTHSPIDSFLATSKDYKLLSWVYSITKQGAFCNDISCLHNNNEALMDHLIISIKSDLMVLGTPRFQINSNQSHGWIWGHAAKIQYMNSRRFKYINGVHNTLPLSCLFQWVNARPQSLLFLRGDQI